MGGWVGCYLGASVVVVAGAEDLLALLPRPHQHAPPTLKVLGQHSTAQGQGLG